MCLGNAARGAATGQQLDGVLRDDVAHGFSGSVLIERDGRLLEDEGFGSLKSVSAHADSRYWIASAGKQFVSAAILVCQDLGLLSLDDPLGRFFSRTPADKRAITIRQLLAHISGLDQTYASEGINEREDAVQRMLARPLIAPPGTGFHYSNDNYQLAAAIVEVVSGDSYHDFIVRRFWRPLGMRHTGFGSAADSKTVLPAVGDTPERLLKAGWGEAGVYSTTRDLRIWYRALTGGRVLSSKSLELLFAPVVPIHEGQAALGWFRGTTAHGSAVIFTRGNEDFGANSLVYDYPGRETLIIVLSHAGSAPGGTPWSRLVLGQLEGALGL